MNVLNGALLSQIVNVVNALSSVLDLPGKVLSVIAVPSAIIAYVSGRRRSLFEGSNNTSVEVLQIEMRQGFQTLAAAIAALAAGEAVTLTAPPAATTPPAGGQPAAESVGAATATFTLPGPPPTLEGPAAAPRPRVRYVALAAVSALALVMTLCFIGAYIISGQYATRPESELLANNTYNTLAVIGFLGLIVTALALIWACIRALMVQRYGWAAGLFLGTLVLTAFTLFSMPGLLILIFAIWGPGRRPTTEAATPASTVAMSPEFAGVRVGVSTGHGADDREPPVSR